MSKKILIILLIVLISIVAWRFYSYYVSEQQTEKSVQQELWDNYEIVEKTIEGKTYRLILADNPDRWQKGLMFVRKPVSDFDGMIFIFPDYDYRIFWNLNTFEDLTLYWMKDDVVTGTSELPSIEKSKEIVRVSSSEPVNIVVEVIK